MVNPDSHCLELVLYKVKSDRHELFCSTRAKITEELSRLPGFIASQTLRSLDEGGLHVDLVTWADASLARAAYAAFKDLPAAGAFMEMVEHVQFSGHFISEQK